MSKFFNETRTTASHGSRPLKREVDVKEVIDALKDRMGQRSTATVKVTEATPDELRSRSAIDRLLQDCRQVSLPRNNEKSFLARQYSPDLQAAVEAYRMLRTRLLKKQAQRNMRSLAVSSTAPGDGKTLSALNLALCYSHLPNRSILLIDGDFRTKGLSTVLRLQRCAGLSNLLESVSPYESAILRTDFPNLYVLPAGTASTPAGELFSLGAWKEFVAWSASVFQMVLVDSPPVLDLADTELIISACDALLLVARSGNTKRRALAQILNQVDTKKLIGVVFNGCEEAAARNYYRYGGAEVTQETEP